MQNPINLSPITQFIQSVRAAEQTQSREVKMPMQQARMMVLALAEIQDKLLQDYETMFNQLKNNLDTDVVNVSMDGGGFEEP